MDRKPSTTTSWQRAHPLGDKSFSKIGPANENLGSNLDLAADDLYDRAEKGNFERARSLSLAIVIVPPSARRRKEEKGSVDRSTAVNKHRVREEHAVKQYIAPLVASLTERNNVSVHERHRATVCRGAYTPRREAVGHRKNNTHNRLLNCVPRQWTK